jgi:glycerol-3-phosphate dehydrogenase (NAD(P)+)
METIAILGAGSWGTALAVHLGELGHTVRLWARSPALVADLRERRANAVYLPDVMLPPAVEPTATLPAALAGARIVVAVVPSHGMRRVLREAVPAVEEAAVLVSATKGLEEDSLLRMSDVIAQEAGRGHPVVVLSGPSLAREVGLRRPTALLVASRDADAAALVQEEFHGPTFRLYGSDDVVGVEVGGAMKNVIAIGAGVVDSLRLGPNAMAALITRGLAEMSRLADALGGRRETLAGLSGLGDLVLTCTSSFSRNHHVGVELGKGRRLFEILAGMKMVAEGVRTTHAALALGRRHRIELPITEKMEEVLAGQKDPRTATFELMLRPQKFEREGADC